jgi:hypothetical protein
MRGMVYTHTCQNPLHNCLLWVLLHILPLSTEWIDRMSLRLLPPYVPVPSIDDEHEKRTREVIRPYQQRFRHTEYKAEHIAAIERGHRHWLVNHDRWHMTVTQMTRLLPPLVALVYSYHSSFIYSLVDNSLVLYGVYEADIKYAAHDTNGSDGNGGGWQQ